MLERVVVLGTGTGVGKTWVTAALAQASAGSSLALKPIESGCERGQPAADAALLAEAARSPYAPPLYAFEPPVAPWAAATQAGQTIDLQAVIRWVGGHERQALRDTTRHVTHSLIESAGGLFSPLSASATNYELAQALEPCIWVLVAPNRLGVLHDVTSALLAMRQRGSREALVVLNACGPEDASCADNAALLGQLHAGVEFFSVARDDRDDVARLYQRLRR